MEQVTKVTLSFQTTLSKLALWGSFSRLIKGNNFSKLLHRLNEIMYVMHLAYSRTSSNGGWILMWTSSQYVCIGQMESMSSLPLILASSSYLLHPSWPSAWSLKMQNPALSQRTRTSERSPTNYNNTLVFPSTVCQIGWYEWKEALACGVYILCGREERGEDRQRNN